MNRLVTIALLSLFAIAPATADDWTSDYAFLLNKYVFPSGVAYAKWKANSSDIFLLNSVIGRIKAASPSSAASDEQLAFYLNAYNAWILKRILDDYPTKGPGNGSALKRAYFFKSRSITVASEKTSFSSLENDIIRPRFKEPRIHFALNCASASCPPLQSKPFAAATLNADLNQLTHAYLNTNPDGLRVEKGVVYISEIFDWYADDFKPNALAFINSFRETQIPAGSEIQFHDYDWALNEAR